METLSAADALMPKGHYPSSLLAQLAHHIPSMLLSLFESSITMWKARCKLIHPPVPLPLVRVNASALRRLRSRQGYYRSTTPQTQTSQTSSLSSLPTPTHSQVSLTPMSTTPLFSQVPNFPVFIEDPPPVTYMSVPPVVRFDSDYTTTYISVLPTQPSPYRQIRMMSLEAAAAFAPSEADCSPPSSFQ